MTLKNQVCSLDLAKRLKGLGVPQESYFEWLHSDVTYPAGNKNTRWFIYHGLFNTDPYEKIDEACSAFTVAELGELLPVIDMNGWVETVRWQDHWRCNLQISSTTTRHFTHSETEADARAKMMIYLLERRLIENA